MNLQGTCTCGQPIVGGVRQQLPGGPLRESWLHLDTVNPNHTATPADGTVGPKYDPAFVMYPEVEVELIGQDGNAFTLIALTKSALRREVGKAAADRFFELATQTGSYDELLAFIQNTVTVR